MANVLITRHFSGFWNVADNFSVGNDEHHGNAASGEYRLPEGYSVAGGKIYDKNDIECAIVGQGDSVVVVSRAGTCPDAALEAI